MYNSDIFISVRQRRVALQWYFEYKGIDWKKLDLDDILDYAYRFLNWSVDDEVLRYFAKKENMDFDEYKNGLVNSGHNKEVD